MPRGIYQRTEYHKKRLKENNSHYPGRGFQQPATGWRKHRLGSKKNNMLKIIGDKGSGKQFILGVDNKLRHIFNPTILHDLNNAGVINESEVNWQDNIDGYEISEPWAVIKQIN